MASINVPMQVANEAIPRNPALTPELAFTWRVMRVTDAGQETIKAHDAKNSDIYIGNTRQVQGDLLFDTFLPIPGGFVSMWSNGGRRMWRDYMERAQFPSVIAPAINSMVGIVHKSEWRIELPPQLEYLFEKATENGKSLEAFTRCITREQLLMGRYGISVDRPMEGGDPYLVGHLAESIINWDRDWYVIDESGYVRDGMKWEEVVKYREYGIDERGYYQQVLDDSGAPEGEPIYPQGAGGVMDFVPMVIVGARDIGNDVEQPPMMGAANAALALYRLDADYRHQLYMSGQETLVIDNGEAPENIGPSVALELKSNPDAPSKAYYVGPTCNGIKAHREAIADEWENAAKAGAKLFDSGAAIESGDARRMRQNAESATLQTIANSGASGLEKALKYAAEMVGANPDDVVVEPPTKLLDAPMQAAEVVNLVKAWREGGMSWQTLYENLQRGQIASRERDADGELALMNTDFAEEDPAEL